MKINIKLFNSGEKYSLDVDETQRPEDIWEKINELFSII